MSLMLLQSNSNQKYPMWTHSSHRATWSMVMPRIILEFKAKKCWDYVDPDNAPNDNNNGILENTFQEEEINVADRVAQEEQALALVYDQQFQSTVFSTPITYVTILLIFNNIDFVTLGLKYVNLFRSQMLDITSQLELSND